MANASWDISLDPQWLARRSEDIIDPLLAIVDAHHHVWDRPGNRYLLDEMLADTGSGHNIQATVFVQCRAMYRADGAPELRPLGEVEFANGIAAMSASGAYGPARICAAIVGHADLRLGADVKKVLEAELAAGSGRFCGIRHVTTWDADAALVNPAIAVPRGLLSDTAFRKGYAQLGPLGLSFDAWLYHPQIDELCALARDYEDTTIVLDHLGSPLRVESYASKKDQVFADWSASIKRLASHPNVVVKLGGLGMSNCGFGFHQQAEPPSSETLAQTWRPFIETCIAAFGPERCMFESNFPVDKMSCSYHILWNAFKRLAAGMSDGERSSLFFGTAARVYKIGLAPR